MPENARSSLAPLRHAAAVAIACLLLVGCASDSDGGGSAAARAPAPDRELAEQARLTLEDFPSGWTAADADSRKIAKCDAVDAANRTASARARSPLFTHGENTETQTTIYLFADEQAARDAFDGISAQETRDCYVKQLTAAITASGRAKVRDVKTTRLSIDPLGDRHDAARITVAFTAHDIDADLVIDLIYVRVGRGLSLSVFLDVFSAFDEKLRAKLTAASADRLANALA
jgi:hypothetical protein